jgi:hypothetical protein
VKAKSRKLKAETGKQGYTQIQRKTQTGRQKPAGFATPAGFLAALSNTTLPLPFGAPATATGYKLP